MDIALLVIGLLAFGGSFYPLIRGLYSYRKAKSLPMPNKTQGFLILGGALGISLGFMLLNLALVLANPSWAEVTAWAEGTVFEGEAVSYGGNLALILIFSFLFALSFVTLWSNFYLHFRKEGFDEKTRKLNSWLLYGAIPLAVIFFCLFTSGYGPYLSYPFINGASIGGKSGWLWTTAHDRGATEGGLHVAFYGIFIVFGVFVCYWISDHYFFKKYGKHGILDIIAVVGFLCGIIGARLWYVVGNWDREFANASFDKVFAIWDGGLTILGGAALGILGGVITARLAKPYVDLRWGVDVIVPTILLAQAIGRTGNFFNCEVYGQVVSVDGWRFLPNWLLAQMGMNGGSGHLAPGLIHVPLFLIEAVISICGFFVLYVVIGKLLAKWRRPGDLAGCYFIWYGVVRAIMEPLRDSAYNMGTDNAWSVINSLAYILIGVAIVLFFHLFDDFRKRKDGTPSSIAGAFFLLVSLFLPLAVSLTATEGTNTFLMGYVGYDIIFSGKAPADLAAWVLALLALLLSLASIGIRYWKKEAPFYKYFLYGASLLAVISAALLFFATGNGGIEEVPGATKDEVNFNVSYGFAIMAILLLVSLVPSASILIADIMKAREGKKALAGGPEGAMEPSSRPSEEKGDEPSEAKGGDGD